MVVFTCYHCGDSLQKPKVEKHINFECKKKFLNPRLCCVDCLKDFDVKSYVEHTKCVSEEERYSAKGFVPKPSSNKGEKKQNSWTEVIQAVLKKPNLNEPQRKLLKALSNYSNVPRKQQKFKNFISSSLKHLKANNATMDEVFKLIDTEYKASSAANADANQVQKKDSVNSQKSDESEKVEKSEDAQSDDKSVKKKKKNKNKQNDNETTDIPQEPTSLEEKANLDESAAFEVVKKKKKRSKKQSVENETTPMEVDKPDNTVQSNDTTSNGPSESNADEDVSLKGISKKLKKSNLQEARGNPPTDDSQPITQNDATEIAPNDVSLLENNHSEEVNMKGLSKKKLKKLKLLQEVHENPPCDDSQTNITQDSSTIVDSNDVSTTKASPEKPKSTDEVVAPVEKNLSKKERKEMKKRLKYEAELKAIETETVEADEANANVENETDENQKPKTKKKRKLSENVENEKAASKKTKVTESVTVAAAEENSEPTASKFKWESVIRAVLEKADENEIGLKKLTKKVVAEYQACYGEETPYDEVLRKVNKKIAKCPFVRILKDQVKLIVSRN